MVGDVSAGLQAVVNTWNSYSMPNLTFWTPGGQPNVLWYTPLEQFWMLVVDTKEDMEIASILLDAI